MVYCEIPKRMGIRRSRPGEKEHGKKNFNGMFPSQPVLPFLVMLLHGGAAADRLSPFCETDQVVRGFEDRLIFYLMKGMDPGDRGIGGFPIPFPRQHQ